jgi:hypothetical protein
MINLVLHTFATALLFSCSSISVVLEKQNIKLVFFPSHPYFLFEQFAMKISRERGRRQTQGNFPQPVI